MNTNKITDEMIDKYVDRTIKHILRVIKYGKKINRYYKEHDNDKLSDVKIIEPYIFLTWKKAHKDFKISKDIECDINNATRTHILNNTHHPEYWDDDSINNTKDFSRENPNPNGIYDATKMPKSALDEMVCDWCAMAEEMGEKTPKTWADKNVNKRWRFTNTQKEYIYKMIDKIWN